MLSHRQQLESYSRPWHYDPVDATEIFVVIAVALFASIAQGLAGFGFGVIAVPFFLLILNVADAVVVATLLTIANVALMATRLRGAVCWLPVGRLVVGSLAGMPVGTGEQR